MSYDPISRQFVHPPFVVTHVREDGTRAMLHADRDGTVLYDAQYMSGKLPIRRSFITRSSAGFHETFTPC